MKVLSLGVLAALMLGSSAQVSNAGERINIGQNKVTTNGCHDYTGHFTTDIPNSAQLDRAYHGVVDGIEVVEFTGNGTRDRNNFVFTRGGTALSYDLHVKGAGHWVRTIGHGGICVGAKGASLGVIIYAHYK